MFYTKKKLLKQYFPCTPVAKHPGSSADITTIDFSGTELKIYAPPSGYEDAFFPDVNPEPVYDLSQLDVWKNKDLSNEDNVPSYYEIINWNWPFYGPWFTGVRCYIQFHVYLITDVNLNRSGSMFEQQVLYDFLNDQWVDLVSHRFNSAHQLEVKSIARDGDYPLPNSSLVFNVSHTSNTTSRFIDTKIGVPVSENQMLLIDIECRLFKDYEGDFRENWINTENMDQYVENIVSTISVTLSDKAKAATSNIKSASFETITTQL